MSEVTSTNEETKVKYATVGTIKTVVLTKDAYAFTLEPISAYRFLIKNDYESSWKIIFKESKDGIKREEKNKDNLPKLLLIAEDAKFTVKDKLADALIVLKQNKAKIEVVVETASGMSGDNFVVSLITVK